MYHSNRVKQRLVIAEALIIRSTVTIVYDFNSALIKEQNDGLASELESFSFKPRINQTSLDLSATMKSLSSRIPELVAEKDKLLEAKRRELKAQEVAGSSSVYSFSMVMIMITCDVHACKLYRSIRVLFQTQARWCEAVGPVFKEDG
jgi:hypothetical protein